MNTSHSVLVRVPQDLVDTTEDVLLPTELDLLLLLGSRDTGLHEMNVRLVLLRVLEDDLNYRWLLPVIEPPLHLDILPRTESEILAEDLTLKDREGSTLDGLGYCLGPRIVSDASV